ncbi:hypothetical protein D920_00376 [Enterococcus faecalis 13-SD-W-01]|nr:hypothetical protein D920_00376 [Enterococcus faecalis 13-SD-W-01]
MEGFCLFYLWEKDRLFHSGYFSEWTFFWGGSGFSTGRISILFFCFIHKKAGSLHI